MTQPSHRVPVPPEQRETLSYRLLRGVARLAVRWYYREVAFDGASRIPAGGPVLLVVNHPNELMDAIFAGIIAPRQLTFTGKATLFANPAIGAFLRHMRVVPLRRVQDELAQAGGAALPDAARNAQSFAAIHAALESGQMVLIFPEGRSWDEPRLAPIRTGTARIALSARQAGVAGIAIVPVGINYEGKHSLRSRVLVEVGAPILLDALPAEASTVDALTAEISRRLHAVTLNFTDDADAAEVLDVATVLAATTDEVRPLDDPDAPIAAMVDVARRADAIRDRMARGDLPAPVQAHVVQVQHRLLALRRTATGLGIRLDDVILDTGLPAAGRFVVRELLLAAVGVPLAMWGRLNHFLPFTLTRWLGRATASAKSNLAMNTVVLGVLLVPSFYVLQTALVWWLTGGGWALAYAGLLIPSASWDIRYSERLRDLRMRARAWRAFRDDPGLQARLRTELFALRDEAAAIATGVAAM
ncbi:MAG: 1-acyl-sn-glycerol-3-phosphate acyltransferase [Gemmatimonadaceae bacterium]|nr:1-acyl-sn-glycerol-3-phosphate acyltransferase [Gemmatimonadaceae bacterium]